MKTKLRPIHVSMFRTGAGRYVRVTYRCDCPGNPHACHWRFDFPVNHKNRIGTCDEAAMCNVVWKTDDTLIYQVFEFMELRAANVAMDFLAGK